MTVVEIALTPSGHLLATERADHPSGDDSGPADGRLRRIAKAFASSRGEGLFVLGAERSVEAASPSLAYWRDFAGRYLTELCHTPEQADAQLGSIPPPPTAELATLLLGVPPMQGAEVPDRRDVLRASGTTWTGGSGAGRRRWQGLSGFLKEHAPLWHQVGRVCFHLAENRHDPDYPFAFLATYAPSLTSGGRVQYQPLSKALQQYGRDARTRKRWSSCSRPSIWRRRTSPLVKELVDSGDIYQPLAWTPQQALPLPQGRAGLRGKRRPGAAARLVEETSAAPRGRDHRRQAAEDVRLPRACSTSRCSWPWGTRAHRGRMARVAGRRGGTGLAARPVGRGRSRKTDRGLGPLEESSRREAAGRAFVHRGNAAAGRCTARPG